MADATSRKYKLVSTLTFGDVFVQALIWLILITVTLGLAVPFFAYYFVRLMINTTEIHEVGTGGDRSEPRFG